MRQLKHVTRVRPRARTWEVGQGVARIGIHNLQFRDPDRSAWPSAHEGPPSLTRESISAPSFLCLFSLPVSRLS